MRPTAQHMDMAVAELVIYTTPQTAGNVLEDRCLWCDVCGHRPVLQCTYLQYGVAAQIAPPR
jgi:hypothetical protein